MGAWNSTPKPNNGVNTTGTGVPLAVTVTPGNAGKNAAYNALNAAQKQLVNNVRKTYGNPTMPVKEALELGAVPQPQPGQGGGRRKTRKNGKSRKAKKSKRTGRK